MKRKAHTQKNTLLKNAQGNAESNFFKRVFFSPTQKEIQINFFQRTVRNRTDIALNDNLFEQSAADLKRHIFGDAHDIKIKRNKKNVSKDFKKLR